jgi:signal transduction histidine kinase
MDTHINKRMTLILTLFVIGASVTLLFHTPKFSVPLLLLSITYTTVVLVRDYILKIELQQKTGSWFLIFQLALALVIAVLSESFFAQIYLFVLIGEFTFHHSRTYSIIFTTVSYACNLLGILIYRWFPPFEEIYFLIPRVIDYFAIFGMSFLAKIAVHQKNELARDNEQLRIASIELGRKAQLQERTRISREIHDSVGHTLTSAITGLQTAALALEKNQYPLAIEMVERTKEYVMSGLNDVRSSVHLLRLIEETKKSTNVKIEYDIGTMMSDLPPLIEITIYRALQEGLTNGIRHGFSSTFHFSLTFHSEVIRFILSDNGKAPIQIVYGFGLNAMKERLDDVGGELLISNNTSTSGVTLEITIPFQMITGRGSEQIV